MKKIIFVCNSLGGEGLGHFTRCFNIAKGIKEINDDIQIYFDGKYCQFALSKIDNTKFKLLENGKRDLFYSNSIVIFDSYKHNQKIIDDIGSKSFHSIKIDDFNRYNLNKIDSVINFRVDSEYETYYTKNKFIGLKYYPSDLELLKIRKRNIINFKKNIDKKSNKILVFIGGNDNYNIGERIIKEIDRFLYGRTIIWATRFSEKKKLKIANNKLLVNDLQFNISEYLKDIDFVICGGGLIKYESTFSLIPCLSISQNSDQEIDSQICHKNGIIYNLGLHNNIFGKKDYLKSNINKFMNNNLQIKFKNNILNKYDTNSIFRLSEKIIEFLG